MIKLNLTTSCKEHELIKEFLEQNVSETLAEKINNGVRIEKDGITLINNALQHPVVCLSHNLKIFSIIVLLLHLIRSFLKQREVFFKKLDVFLFFFNKSLIDFV